MPLKRSVARKRFNPHQFEDVHEIVELSVDVAADGELAAFRDVDVDEARLRLEVLLDVDQDL